MSYSLGPSILFNLGQASLRNGDNQNAELALSRFLKLKPNSPDTQYLFAMVYTNESRPLDAPDVLVRANKFDTEESGHSLSDGSNQHFTKVL
jgi:outer membrane protein assembly factor BamD (BamD/ComL family)